MSRLYNFCAGPAALPTEVLERAQREMLDWGGLGLSVMEMSHRSDEFQSIAKAAEADLRELLQVPDDYRVLFIQGGATAQFSAVPLNLMELGGEADYLDTGLWSGKAIDEARRFGKVNVVASGKSLAYSSIASQDNWQISERASYFHYTPNETIGGLELFDIPSCSQAPLIADMSSTILSRPVDVSRFGLIYAGAQKNIGPAGLTLVIVREDLLGKAQAGVPRTMNYQLIADHESMLNTPPTYSWYLAGLVFQWLKHQGGLGVMAERNQRKAEKLYAAIDRCGLYGSCVDLSYRSSMNVPFTLKNKALDDPFLSGARERGLLNLKGHRSVGGMRASIYNAVSEAAVDALVSYMNEFDKQYG
ncbi:3-phosphoserine/phosphohydroxythreonine transaminase [Aestuariirhabdus sp. Z084]|uniref:3-phosphoserine/phosphohydroxythreonine transaminase n=1 Tax=Aestuariirhabdus haliotis TaxID=2918751 RepID=UPI00201B4525|nr:3-phosphoserine/phosphohydroxythreonine transaminase [Aestuariirhabdus haliotis]MCL6417004.1 3-phosphoserine/phosphohydroxythreonine transaminase [Aestuariirhabdus haliotis]MCL6421037.1 3-phosphoserine/phosphohydroxythreonine transaminase [Aestuariirhabdus haliotis]